MTSDSSSSNHFNQLLDDVEREERIVHQTEIEKREESFFVLNPGIAKRTKSCSLGDSDERVRTIYTSIMYSGERSKEWYFHPLYPTKYDGVIHRLKVKVLRENDDTQASISSMNIRTFFDLKKLLHSFYALPWDASEYEMGNDRREDYPYTQIWICYNDNPFLPLDIIEKRDNFIERFEILVGIHRAFDHLHFLVETRIAEGKFPLHMLLVGGGWSWLGRYYQNQNTYYGNHEGNRSDCGWKLLNFFDKNNVSKDVLPNLDWKPLRKEYACFETEDPEFTSERVQYVFDGISSDPQICLKVKLESLEEGKCIFVPKIFLN